MRSTVAMSASCPRHAPIQLASWLPQAMLDGGLAHEQIDDAVEARAAIAEVAGDDDLGDREVPDHVRAGAEQIEIAPGAHERVDERVDEAGALLDAARGDELAEEAGEAGREELLRVAEGVAAGQLADDLHLARQRGEEEGATVEPIALALPRVRLARVVDEGQEIGGSPRPRRARRRGARRAAAGCRRRC